MPLSNYLLGLLDLALVFGGVGAVSWLCVSRRAPDLTGAERVSAFGLVFCAALILVHLLPAMLGVLGRTAVLVALAALLAASLRIPRSRAVIRAPAGAQTRGAMGSPTSVAAGDVGSRALAAGAWALAAIALGALGAYTLNYLRHNASAPVIELDALTFHLPNVARWIQTGSVWRVDQFNPDLAQGNYPQNGDFVLLSLVLPFRNDAFVRLAMYPLLALAGTSVYALARELRARAPAALLASALVLALPAVMQSAVQNLQTDLLLVFAFPAGLLFLARHAREPRRHELALAGLGLGLAFGTKWYAVPGVGVVIALWFAAILRGGCGWSRGMRDALLLCATTLLAGGFWLLRNLVVSGNPVFPAKIAPLGVTIFDAPRDTLRERIGFTVGSYLDDPHVLVHSVVPGLRVALGISGLVAAFGALAVVVLAVLRTMRRRDAGRNVAPEIVVAAVAALALALTAIYIITPDTADGPPGHPLLVAANARYLVPAVICAAVTVAWLCRLWARAGPLLELAVLVCVLDGIARSFGSAATVGARAKVLGVGILVAAVAAATRWGLQRTWPVGGAARLLRSRARALIAIAAMLMVVAGVGGELLQRRFNHQRYAGYDAAITWLTVHAPTGHRVGLVGSWSVQGLAPVFPAFGPRLRNVVIYVGLADHSLLRVFNRFSLFAAAVHRGRYDLLLVGRGLTPSAAVPEQAWVRQLGYLEVASSPRLVLYRLA